MYRPNMRFTAFPLIIVILASCNANKARQQEGFELIQHKGTSYVFIWRRADEGRFVITRLTGTCQSYKWGDREPIEGDSVCSLDVGTIYESNTLKQGVDKAKHVDIFFTPVVFGDRALTIVQGDGQEKTTNTIEITDEKLVSAEQI